MPLYGAVLYYITLYYINALIVSMKLLISPTFIITLIGHSLKLQCCQRSNSFPNLQIKPLLSYLCKNILKKKSPACTEVNLIPPALT